MPSIPFKAKPLSLIICASALMVTLPVSFANEDDDAVERVEIVGSHIKRIDTEGSSPVQTISREDIERSGVNSVQQLLFSLPSNGAGSFNSSANSQDETSIGSAGISFRGLGADSTLVLINGRRAAVSPFADSITTSFVDLNTIPLAAVERVEILKDGASALYGSDAMAGVVNVVLKRDFEGVNFNASYGDSQESTDESEQNYSLLFGMGNETTHATVIFEYYKRNTQMLRDRIYSASADQSAKEEGTDARSTAAEYINYTDPTTKKPATVDGCPADRITRLDTGGERCRFDYAPFITAMPGGERNGMILTADHEFTPSLQAFFDLAVQRNSGMVSGAPSPSFNEFVFPVLPGKPFQEPVEGIRRRFVEAGPRVYVFDNDSFRALAGLRGELSPTWDWEIAYANSRTEIDQRSVSGFVREDLIQQSIDAGAFDPFIGSDPGQQAAVDAFTTRVTRYGKSTTNSADVKFSGELMDFGDSAIAMAVGLEYREEFINDQPDKQFSDGLIVGTENTSAFGERDLYSAYTELYVPFSEQFEMQFALRHEDYSDFGTTTNPKIAFRYLPSEQLAIRASWGTGFRAPSLVQLGLGETNESPDLVDTSRCDNGDADACQPVEYTTELSGNPNLEAEESESYNLGAVFQLNSNLNFAVDYWNYRFDNIIDKNTQALLLLEARGLLAPGIVVRFAPDADDIAANRPGPIDFVNDTFDNLGFRETDGIDLDVNYTSSVLNGDLALRFNWTHILSFDEQVVPGGPIVDLNGEYQRPENRWNLSANWSRDDWSVTTIANFIGEYKDDFELGKTRTVDSWLTFDTNFAYSGWDSTTVRLGVDNLLDEDPPYSASEFQGYDFKTHDARGRFVFVSYSYHFE